MAQPQPSGAPLSLDGAAAEALGPELASLLVTKLIVPRPRAGAIRRGRLLALLDAGLAAPLTLVAAPAGFGKTTLLADWLAASASQFPSPPKAAWLSLDPGDDDPVAFVRSLVGALRLAGAPVGARTLALLRGAQPLPLTAALVPLLNDLAALPGDTLLVLDDYHVVAEPSIHEAVAFVVERLPPRARLVLATRADPPLPLARLRARGHLVELRAAQLRFTRAEARALLSGHQDLALSDDDIAHLDERAEGWAAALQLAALALREQPDPSALVAAFAGSHRYLFDYLAEEVFERLPQHLRDFLLRTSVLERLNGELCDAVAGLPAGSSAPLLARLEREGLFVLPLDGERRWFRYHQLFAEALRERLRATAAPAALAALYRRAAAAVGDAGAQGPPDPAGAVEYLLAGQLWAEAAERIEGVAPSLLARGQHATVRRWIEAVPPELRESCAALCVLLGVVASRRGELDLAEPLLARGAALGTAGQGGRWRVTALSELALLTFARGQLARSAELVEGALALPAPREARAPGLMLSIFVHTLVGRREAVSRAAAELFAALRGHPDPLLLAHALEGAPSLALALFDQIGPLEELCRAGLRALGDEVSLARIGAEAGLAHIAWLRGRLDEALAMSERARQTSDRFGAQATVEPQMVGVAGLVALARGDLEGAALHYAYAQRSAGPLAMYDSALPGRLYRLALVRWQQGRLEDVREAKAALDAAPVVSELAPAIAGLLNALLALAAGAYDEAEALLRPIAAREATVGLMAVFGSAHPLIAYVELRRDRPDAAAAAMAPLLAACARDGTPGRLLLEGPYIAPLLRLAATHGPCAAAATEALAILEARGARREARREPEIGVLRASAQTPERFVEPLSERELQVLRLLAAGQSNRAIAERLVVTVGTVKRHVSNLMDKLGAESRLAAVARARELGLL